MTWKPYKLTLTNEQGRDYCKMGAISVQREKNILKLGNICFQLKEQLMEINIDMENHTHELQV